MIVTRGWGRADLWIGAIVAYGYGRLQLVYVLRGDRTQAIVLNVRDDVLVEEWLRGAILVEKEETVLLGTGVRQVEESSGKRAVRMLGLEGMTSDIGRRQVSIRSGIRRVAGGTGKTGVNE